MGATYNQRIAFCHYLFDTFATAELRLAYVKKVAASANDVGLSGGAISATSANGASVQFQIPSGWSNDDILGLTNEARSWAACVDADAAIALIEGPARFLSSDFSGLRV